MLKEMKNNEKGFTLVELIVVVAIMAVLGTLLIPRIIGNVSDAKKQREIATAQTIASEITVYNANAVTDDDPLTTPVPAKTALVAGDLTGDLALPSGITFPDSSIVTISVDDKGNASVNIH